jgi:undecaprenyl diphosphate synthase
MLNPELAIIPRHVAIIMDGNGRWANKRGLPRTIGHSKGVEAVRETVKAAAEAGVEYLTLFAFSSENWTRPETEVNDLLGLLRKFIRRDLAELHRENVRIRVIGEREKLRSDILPLLLEAEETTRHRDVQAGVVSPDSISAEAISRRLDTADIPDPDLIIRTSGEERLSNFLLWQAAYSELLFMPEYWPDFDRKLFFEALKTFASRDRRFGGLSTKTAAVAS